MLARQNQTITENYSGLSLQCSLGRDISGGCREMTLAHYREVYGCIMTPISRGGGAKGKTFQFFKIVGFIHNAMQYMINEKETKVQNKVLNKIERDRYKGSMMLLLFSVQLLAYLITSSFMTKLCSNLDTSSECCLWSTSAAYNLLTKTQYWYIKRHYLYQVQLLGQT